MSVLRYDNKSIIITGAGGGLGRSYSKLLASRGAAVIVNDLGNAASKTVSEIETEGGRAVAIQGDVVDPEVAQATVEAALSLTGSVDGLMNNAGIGFEMPFMDTSFEDFRRVMDVHYFGTLNMTRAVWPHMITGGSGHILNITSANIFGLANWSPYSAAKAAVFGLGRTLALEGRPHGIRVNMLAPVAHTTMLTENITEPKILEAAQESTPELVGPVAAYLMHESCPFNGRTFHAGGGRVSSVFLGRTQGDLDTDLTVERVAEILADKETHEGFFSVASTLEHAT